MGLLFSGFRGFGFQGSGGGFGISDLGFRAQHST